MKIDSEDEEKYFTLNSPSKQKYQYQIKFGVNFKEKKMQESDVIYFEMKKPKIILISRKKLISITGGAMLMYIAVFIIQRFKVENML